MTETRIPAGVAAGHPETARIGLAILADGGSAADAVAAMIVAGSVAETIFSGLAGGGFATHYAGRTGEITCHDFFVAVPGLDGTAAGRGSSISIEFGGVPMPYEVGGATVAVPGTPCGVEALHTSHGRLPWARIVRPARDLAATGSDFSPAHASMLLDVAPAMMLNEGIPIYSTTGVDESRVLLRANQNLFHPGLDETLDLYLDQGAAALMTGEFGRRFVSAVRADGGALSLADMAAYHATTITPVAAPIGDATVYLRGNDLDDVAGTIAQLDIDQVRAGNLRRALALVSALQGTAKRAETTSVVAVDSEGNACAATHSLGLGSGIWVSGVHGNSMLGEGELLRGALVPGERMGSMMSPLVVTGIDGGLLMAGGAAGGSRIRGALLQVLSSVLVEGMLLPQAVSRPRLSVAGNTVHLEPGFEPDVAPGLTAAGYEVLHWAEPKPYFGGVSAADSSGPAADPRRGGLALTLP